MRICRHCGQQNGDDAPICSECGLDLADSPLRRFVSRWSERRKNFFRWKPASVVLIVLVVLYGVLALVNLWIAIVLAKRGEQQMVRFMISAALWNVVIAALCFAGRQMMRCQTRRHLQVGMIAVVAGHLVVMRIWILGLLRGQNPFPIIEALVIWPLFAYAIIYAYQEIKRSSPN